MISAVGSHRPSPYAYASAGGPTPTPPVMAPVSVASPVAVSNPSPVTAQSSTASSFLSVLTGIWSGIVNFFKGVWNKLFGSTQAAQPLDSTSAQVAQQYNLLPTEANVQAFLVEARSYEQNGTLGPGSPSSNAIAQIQQALASWGYSVNPSGTWDQATSNAVIAFKQKNGIHQTYQMADGSWAVNAYVDNNTLSAMRQLMQGQTPPATGTPTTGQPTQPAPVTQPTSGVQNWQAIAQQYGLLSDPTNVQAFLTEVQGYQNGSALGPGSADTADIKQLQQLLHDKFGFSAVNPTGTWDQATSQAVIAYKTQNGLHQTYKAADGNWAINEYADSQTLKLMMQQAGLPNS